MTQAASKHSSSSPRTRAAPADSVIAGAGLPPTLADLVRGVVTRCRLWRRERDDVARELCGHFLDGLEAGAASDVLASEFGDPVAAARLITAAKKRLRPTWWRASRAFVRAVCWTIAVCSAAYAVLAARYFLASPTIRHNYTAELRAAAMQTPESQRGWPLYVKAMREFGPHPDFMQSDNPDPRRPGDVHFDQMARFLDAHPEALRLLREAAARPAVGYPWSDVVEPEYARALEVVHPRYRYDPSAEKPMDNPLLIGTLLPHLGQLRTFSRWLAADAHLAAARNEAGRFVADVEAMAGISDQLLREPFLISQVAGLAVGQLLNSIVLECASRADLLDEERLRRVAHRIAAIGGGRVTLDATGERLMIEDIVQRFYSDDGEGGGRLVGGPESSGRAGTEHQMFESWGLVRPRGHFLLVAFRPVQSAVMPSRAELRAEINRYAGAAARDDQIPPWRHDERTSDEIYKNLMYGVVPRLSPMFASLLGGRESGRGPMASSLAQRDRFEVSRAAALTVLALESFRAATGAYPATLAELSPRYLPALPIDPFDGDPLRYVKGEGADAPRLYSVGADTTDDGGQRPSTREGRQRAADLDLYARVRRGGTDDPSVAAHLESARGDWVFWPYQEE